MAAASPARHHQHDIFLSHSGEQKGFVKDLYDGLSKLGYTVFFDREPHSLPLGEPFPPKIMNAAKDCTLAVVVLSNDFLASKWPMIELCAFAQRLPPVAPLHPQVPAAAFTLLPLFYELSPKDIKDQKNLDAWETQWKKYEAQDKDKHRSKCFNAVECKEAVSKLLTPRNGICRGLKAEQGDSAYTEEVLEGIMSILVPPLRFTELNKNYSGNNRLCDIILNKFRDLEHPQFGCFEHPCPSPAHSFVVPYIEDLAASSSSASIQLTRHIHASILGIYGVPGSGKTTICRILCNCMAYSDEFRGKVLYMGLPTSLEPRDRRSDAVLKEQYLVSSPG